MLESCDKSQHSKMWPPSLIQWCPNLIVMFSLAQAFTPGSEIPGALKAPLMGLLKTIGFHAPGVNAWATENSFKLGHHRSFVTGAVKGETKCRSPCRARRVFHLHR